MAPEQRLTVRKGCYLVHCSPSQLDQVLQSLERCVAVQPSQDRELMAFPEELAEAAGVQRAGDAVRALATGGEGQLANQARGLLRARGAAAHAVPAGKAKRVLCQARAALQPKQCGASEQGDVRHASLGGEVKVDVEHDVAGVDPLFVRDPWAGSRGCDKDPKAEEERSLASKSGRKRRAARQSSTAASGSEVSSHSDDGSCPRRYEVESAGTEPGDNDWLLGTKELADMRKFSYPEGWGHRATCVEEDKLQHVQGSSGGGGQTTTVMMAAVLNAMRSSLQEPSQVATHVRSSSRSLCVVVTSASSLLRWLVGKTGN